MTRHRRIERRVRAMPTRMLRLLLRLPIMADYHEPARREIWLRRMEDLVVTASDFPDAFMCAPVEGLQ